MAGQFNSLYIQNFTSVSSITVTHNLGKTPVGLFVRLIVANVSRPDLISQVYPTATDPTNSIEVVLTSSQSGYVQILDSDILKAGTGADFVNTFNFQTAVSAAESNTQATTYQQKLRLTTTSLIAGDYIIFWTYEFSHASSANACLTRVQVDDTTDLAVSEAAPNIAYAQGGYLQSCGFNVVTLTAGVHTVDFDYNSDVSNKAAYVRNVRLAIWSAS